MGISLSIWRSVTGKMTKAYELMCVLGCFVIATVCFKQHEPYTKSDPSTDKNDALIETVFQKHSLHSDMLERITILEQNQQFILDKFSAIEKTLIEHVQQHVQQKPTTKLGIYSIFGCRMETIIVSCTSGKTIDIETAHFGQYADRSCANACCIPHPTDDCVESVQDEHPVYWDTLINTCNNQSSCEFVVPSATVTSCVDPNIGEYIQIQYTCSPHSGESGIGFTASASAIRLYKHGDVVIFDKVATNIGGYYNDQTSIFTCPVRGTYLFSASIRQGTTNTYVYGFIMHEGFALASTASSLADFDQGAAVAIVACAVGERVWIECVISEGEVWGHASYPTTSFTGVLIQEI